MVIWGMIYCCFAHITRFYVWTIVSTCFNHHCCSFQPPVRCAASPHIHQATAKPSPNARQSAARPLGSVSARSALRASRVRPGVENGATGCSATSSVEVMQFPVDFPFNELWGNGFLVQNVPGKERIFELCHD